MDSGCFMIWQFSRLGKQWGKEWHRAYSTELLDLFVQLASTPWRGREFKTEFISGKDKLETVPNTLILSIGQL